MISDKPSNIDLRTVALTPGTRTNSAGAQQTRDKVEINERKPPVPDNQTTVKENPPVAPQAAADELSLSAQAQAQAEARREEIKDRVNEAIPKVRELMQKNQRSLDFQVAEEENRVIITVIDKETDKVIRQIPPEDVIQIAESIRQGLDNLEGGSILNSKA
ncbi:MAG: flagellar protein FlaG [Pseudomonadota bacterium]|nr:flagellar protein FlaG [Pseudomonadota bacterium]